MSDLPVSLAVTPETVAELPAAWAAASAAARPAARASPREAACVVPPSALARFACAPRGGVRAFSPVSVRPSAKCPLQGFDLRFRSLVNLLDLGLLLIAQIEALEHLVPVHLASRRRLLLLLRCALRGGLCAILRLRRKRHRA